MPALDEARLRGRLAGDPLWRSIHVLDVVDSTNDEVRRLSAEGAPPGTVVLAERQLGGRGRNGRAWHSAPGQGLWISLSLRPSRPAVEATRWTLAAAVAACEACRMLSGLEVWIKWPNDLTIGRAKLAGMLAEMRSLGGCADELILGCGINVGQVAEDFPPGLRAGAVSLYAAGWAVPDREGLAVCYLRQLADLCDRLERGAWEEVAARWSRLAPDSRDCQVRVRTPQDPEEIFEAVTAGLAEDGGLRVRRRNGSMVTVRLTGSILPGEDA